MVNVLSLIFFYVISRDGSFTLTHMKDRFVKLSCLNGLPSISSTNIYVQAEH